MFVDALLTGIVP